MKEQVTIEKDVMHKALESVLENAKVPMHHHLKVLKAFQKKLDEHAADRKRHETQLDGFDQRMKQFHFQEQDRQEIYTQHKKEREAEVETLHAELARIREFKKGEKGETGEPGKNAIAPTVKEIIEAVLPYIPKPIPGPKGDNGESIDEEQIIEKMVKRIQKGDVIHINHVRGAAAFMKDGIRYRFEELMHGSGGSSSSGTSIFSEIVSGSGTSWTLAHTPKNSSLQLYANGQRLTPGIGKDYTISGTTITTTNAWNTGTLLADYIY